MSMTETAAASVAEPAAELREELLQLLREVSEGKLDGTEIDPSANFFDYGYVDSLSGVEFIARVEENYGVVIEDMELVEAYSSLDAIAAHIAANR